MTYSHNKSQRLVTTTPNTSVGAALESIKPLIPPKLLSGLEIKKVSSNGTINPRILTLSDDLFTVFISHHKVGNAESLKDRLNYKGFKAYVAVVSTVTGTAVKKHHNIRVIDVADILFVQSGFIGSRKLETCKDPDLDPTKIISIFHNNINTMDFLVEDEEDRKAVMSALQLIRDTYHSAKVKVGREELLLRYAWYDTDWNKTGLMEESEFLDLLARINIYVKQEQAIQIFKDYIKAKHQPKKGHRIGGIGVSKKYVSGITFEECLDIVRNIKAEQNGTIMSDIIFNEVFGDEEKVDVSAEEFLTKFLHQRQKEKDATINDVKTLFSDLNSMEICGATYRIGANGKGEDSSIDRMRFREYLTSVRNDLFDPEKQKLDSLSLSRPMPEYWINSSHNTYLTGDQLKSLSSVEMYAVAMQRGCKCLELDCWDDSIGFPIVYHGYTITSKIPFQAIITCVRGYIDANPDTLPIILSLENHCSHSFQEMMADILTDTLEDRLYIPKENDGPLPSPLDLVGKVCIKGKRPPENDDEELSMAVSESIDEEGGDADAEFEDALVDGIVSKMSESSTLSRSKSSASDVKTNTPLPKIVPELARLTLFNGVKFKNFDTSIDLPITDMHSFNETKIPKVLNKDPQNAKYWKEYNKEHMSRTYPAGSRVDSSNYNPVMAWHVGSQLVALNYQTDDSAMTINDGRFRENGGCGYVHRPLSTFPIDDETSSGGKVVLKIKILSGTCLPKPYGESVGEVIDPYVIVRVHDVESKRETLSVNNTKISRTSSSQLDWLDTPKKERKTSSIRDNGFSPQWNNAEYFSFIINQPAVSMLEFIVMDSDKGFIDDCMCKSSLPVSCVRPGIRSVQFYDQCSSQHGPFEFARVLVDVDLKVAGTLV